MNSKGWLYLFFTGLLLELVAIANHWTGIRYFTKPLLVAVLIVWFLVKSVTYSSLKYYIAIALFFSWLGDVFLLMEEKDAAYFIPGLGSFLLAHIIYILFFLRVRNSQQVKKAWNFFVIAVVSVYTAALFFFLQPNLGALKLPVLSYAIILSFMFVCAVHAFAIPNKKAGYWCIIGAALFVISDSILAIHKFYRPFQGTGIAIMFTYGLAQFAIANGSLQYLANTKRGPV
jgi:uncharacterized membrane protein YhhN